MLLKRLLLSTFLIASCIEAQAQAQLDGASPMVSKYHVTDAERAACQQDAITLCSDTYPDEDRLLACMKLNILALTPTCHVAFEAGLKKRHIPF